MRVLWISLLLVASITCAPQAEAQDPLARYYSVIGVSQDPSEKPAQSGSGTAGSGSYYYGSYEPTGGAPGSGAQPSSQNEYPGGHQQTSQGEWSSSSSDMADQEPVFTPVSAEDQVYARKSRSQYRKSNLRFHQFVYVPTEPVGPQEPVYPHHGKGQKGF